MLSRLINPEPSESISLIDSSVNESPNTSPSTVTEVEDSEDQEYYDWLEKQSKLKQNIKKVCRKYGSSVKKSVPSSEFMFDSENNLLFCRNAKVGCLLNPLYISTSNPFPLGVGWHHNLADTFLVTFLRTSSSL